MRVLFERPMSPFSRRVRMMLTHKGLPFERRDTIAETKYADEGRKLSPLQTFPVLLEADGTAIGDSGAIARYLDVVYPDPAFVSRERAGEVALVTSLSDRVLETLVDLGSRYNVLANDPAFASVKTMQITRVQGALDALGTRFEARLATDVGLGAEGRAWELDDIWMYSACMWLVGLPARAATNPTIKFIADLGWVLPASLPAWCEGHRDHPIAKAGR